MANGSASWPGQQMFAKGSACMLEVAMLALHLLNRSPKLSGLRMAPTPSHWQFSGKLIREKKHKNNPEGFAEVFLTVFLLSFCLPKFVWFWERSSRNAWTRRERQKRNIVLGPCALGEKIGFKVQIRCFPILFIHWGFTEVEWEKAFTEKNQRVRANGESLQTRKIWAPGVVEDWNFVLPSSKERYYSIKLTITWHSLWLWYCWDLNRSKMGQNDRSEQTMGGMWLWEQTGT